MNSPVAPNPAAAASVALLIDADNSPASKIQFMIDELARVGAVNIRRAYGNWKKQQLIGWEEALNAYAIQPIQNFDLTKGKNASDMSLVIDAMDILYTKSVTTFALASSDCDFTPLIQRLRAEGKQVIGFGAKNTPEPFINSCTRFLFLEDQPVARSSAGNGVDPRAAAVKKDRKLLGTLRKAVEENEGDDGWALLGAVGNFLSNQGSFDQRNYGFAKLRSLLAATGLFEEKAANAGSSTAVWVRVRE